MTKKYLQALEQSLEDTQSILNSETRKIENLLMDIRYKLSEMPDEEVDL